jgi:Carboxypeptidase regulatory-like domain
VISRWHFVQQTFPVTVNTGNTEIPAGALMISGYDVHVKGQIEGLDLVLFDKKGQTSATKCESNVALTQNEHGAYNSQPLCSAQVSGGAYIFTAIPPGQYLVLPHFRNRNVKVNLNPQSLEIEVQKDSLFVDNSFEITGLSVSGRVLYTSEKGVSNALVTLNGNQQVRTQSDGSYSFENIKTGTYIVKVAADNLQFNEHTVKISMSNPVLPNILPAAFRVCGQVVSEKPYKVVFQKHGSTVLVEQHSEAGSGVFCVYLGNGKYAVNVETSSTDKANGIQ